MKETTPPGENAIVALQNIIDNGITLDQRDDLVSKYFDTTPTESINKSIDKGYPLMGTIATGEANIGHDVMITGYNNSGTIQYFDPETGQYNTKLPAEFTNMRTITKLK